MSNDIKVGDLVSVVKPLSCGCIGDIGFIFVVALIRPTKVGKHYCTTCKADLPDDVVADQGKPGCLYPIYTLKRIPPYEQLEHFRSQELLRRDVKEKA